MSCCWNCQKKNACEKLYLNGEQQQCSDKDKAYESFEDYIRWLAKPSNYQGTHYTFKGDNYVC